MLYSVNSRELKKDINYSLRYDLWTFQGLRFRNSKNIYVINSSIKQIIYCMSNIFSLSSYIHTRITRVLTLAKVLSMFAQYTTYKLRVYMNLQHILKYITMKSAFICKFYISINEINIASIIQYFIVFK